MEEAVLDSLHNHLGDLHLHQDLDLLPSLEEEHRTVEWCYIFDAIEVGLDSYLHPFDYFDFHISGSSVIPVNFYFSEKRNSFLWLYPKLFFLAFLKERVQILLCR